MPQALWLAGDAIERAGTLGLARCARLDPNGDVVRFVYRMGAGEPHLDASAMVAAAAKLDLVANVFQGGAHGTLANRRLEARATLCRLAAAPVGCGVQVTHASRDAQGAVSRCSGSPLVLACASQQQTLPCNVSGCRRARVQAVQAAVAASYLLLTPHLTC